MGDVLCWFLDAHSRHCSKAAPGTESGAERVGRPKRSWLPPIMIRRPSAVARSSAVIGEFRNS